MSARTQPTRLTERVSTGDDEALARLIADVPVGHIGFVVDGQPTVLPIAIAYRNGSVLLHGSTGSRWLRTIAAGGPVSLAVTALDGVLVARSAFESSMHYRSAVLFGTCAPVTGDDAEQALDVLTDALIPGRVSEVRRPTARERAATLVLSMTVEEYTFKQADGSPDDPAEDVAGDAWAGVVPIVRSYGAPVPAPDLRAGIAVPPSVYRLAQPDQPEPNPLSNPV